jgi:hypothetical protein
MYKLFAKHGVVINHYCLWVASRILTKANDAYAEWIIPSQLNEAYKNAQHYSNSSNNTSIPALRIGQDKVIILQQHQQLP